VQTIAVKVFAELFSKSDRIPSRQYLTAKLQFVEKRPQKICGLLVCFILRSG
jgi:hypothetical protein